VRRACRALLVIGVALGAGASKAVAEDGSAKTPCPDTTIASGSNDVTVDGKAAARAGDSAGCGGAVVEGSPDVFINGKLAAIQGGATGGGGGIVTGSSGVFINGKPMAARAMRSTALGNS
jgi:uncharacterized Zn-binding protein involved in type VI secretion